MLKYVAIGAAVGFLIAYVLLSHGNEDLTAPPREVPTQDAARFNPSELLKVQPLPVGDKVQRGPLATDAG